MKPIIVMFALAFCQLPLFAQEQDPQQLKELIKPGSKIFISSNKPVLIKYAKSFLKEGCWIVVNDPKQADLRLKIKATYNWFFGYWARGLFVDPKTDSTMYQTRNSNTVMSFSFNGKRAVMKKLVMRRILPLCN